jgi:hypothetical protein
MALTDKARALILTGNTIGAELPASGPDLRSWISAYPYVKEKNRIGVEVEHRYRGVGNPIFHVLRFEIDASAVENPTYDYDRHMSNVRRVDVASDDGVDACLQRLEQLLASWGIAAEALGVLEDDYPVF